MKQKNKEDNFVHESFFYSSLLNAEFESKQFQLIVGVDEQGKSNK